MIQKFIEKHRSRELHKMETKNQKHIGSGFRGNIRVFILVSIRLYREGLCELLEQTRGLSVIGTASNHSDFEDQWANIDPDVLLLDVNISNGLEIARRVYSSDSQLKMVGLSVGAADDSIVSWAEAGISAFVTEDGSLQDVIDAIHNARTGRLPCNSAVVGKLVRRLAELGTVTKRINRIDRLTEREQEILELVDQGFSNKEISHRLNIEVSTVKNHLHNLMEKLNVHRRERAAAYLREHRGY